MPKEVRVYLASWSDFGKALSSNKKLVDSNLEEKKILLFMGLKSQIYQINIIVHNLVKII